jgi:hypothetical protein
MLFTLMTAITSVSFFAGAMAAAKYAKVGLGGYVLAIIIGLSLAIGNAWMFYKLGGILADRTISYSETQQEWLGRAFYLFALLWLVVASILGNLVTSAVMRLVA